MVETFMVFGEEPPICLESMLMAFAEELGVPVFAPDGFGPGDKLTPMDDFYLKMVINMAAEDTPIADASDEEVDLFFAAVAISIAVSLMWNAGQQPLEMNGCTRSSMY
jgi:tetrathionate reductase subunit A